MSWYHDNTLARSWDRSNWSRLWPKDKAKQRPNAESMSWYHDNTLARSWDRSNWSRLWPKDKAKQRPNAESMSWYHDNTLARSWDRSNWSRLWPKDKAKQSRGMQNTQCHESTNSEANGLNADRRRLRDAARMDALTNAACALVHTCQVNARANSPATDLQGLRVKEGNPLGPTSAKTLKIVKTTRSRRKLRDLRKTSRSRRRPFLSPSLHHGRMTVFSQRSPTLQGSTAIGAAAQIETLRIGPKPWSSSQENRGSEIYIKPWCRLDGEFAPSTSSCHRSRQTSWTMLSGEWSSRTWRPVSTMLYGWRHLARPSVHFGARGQDLDLSGLSSTLPAFRRWSWVQRSRNRCERATSSSAGLRLPLECAARRRSPGVWRTQSIRMTSHPCGRCHQSKRCQRRRVSTMWTSINAELVWRQGNLPAYFIRASTLVSLRALNATIHRWSRPIRKARSTWHHTLHQREDGESYLMAPKREPPKPWVSIQRNSASCWRTPSTRPNQAPNGWAQSWTPKSSPEIHKGQISQDQSGR